MKKVGLILVLSFILNFIWEISQAFLFAPHYVGIKGLLTVHLRASLGDILIVSVVLILDALIFGRSYAGKISVSRLLLISASGFVSAVLVERYALVAGRWAYGPLMPIIPCLNVGLTPILQMALIPPGVISIYTWLKKYL